MKQARENVRTKIYYYFRNGLLRQECIAQLEQLVNQCLSSTVGDEAPHVVTVKRWCNEFSRGRQRLQDKFREGRPKTVLGSDLYC